MAVVVVANYNWLPTTIKGVHSGSTIQGTMDEEQVQQSKFFQTAAAVIVIGLATVFFVLFGLEKSGNYDADGDKKSSDIATKNSETLEVGGPYTK
jgi:hypothetical protein